MSRLVYSFFLWVLLPFIAIRLWVRSRREPGYSKRIGERFGAYKIEVNGPLIWVHAVSVGEVRASIPLVAGLKNAYPSHLVLVTCMTAAGRDAIDRAYGETVLAAFLPYDYAFAVRRFLGHFRPNLAILMETEIWFNLLAECKRRFIPIVLANGRMSSGSVKSYRRLSLLTRPAFETLGAVCAQSEADASRIASLGAHHVLVSGNLKFDARPDPGLVAKGADLKVGFGEKRVLMLASTREGEETLLLNSMQRRLPHNVLVILVPRHPHRFNEVASLLGTFGFSFARRSRGESVAGKNVLLGDTMGEMAMYYSAADIAVIGGSILPYGGQNFIEACAVGVPVVVGPYMQNFSEATRMAVDCGAAIQVRDTDEAVGNALELLALPGRREVMGKAGLRFCAAHSGATVRHLAAIRELLQSRVDAPD